jgi:hypothetical protein
MLGAIVWLVLIAAAAFAVTQVGGAITLVFIAAVLFLAYRRLSLLTFTVTFTVLLAAYVWSAPAYRRPVDGLPGVPLVLLCCSTCGRAARR